MSIEELAERVNIAWQRLVVAARVNGGTRAQYLAAEEQLNHAERQYREAYRKLLEEAGQ